MRMHCFINGANPFRLLNNLALNWIDSWWELDLSWIGSGDAGFEWIGVWVFCGPPLPFLKLKHNVSLQAFFSLVSGIKKTYRSKWIAQRQMIRIYTFYQRKGHWIVMTVRTFQYGGSLLIIMGWYDWSLLLEFHHLVVDWNIAAVLLPEKLVVSEWNFWISEWGNELGSDIKLDGDGLLIWIKIVHGIGFFLMCSGYIM